jgi:hypothetical protein
MTPLGARLAPVFLLHFTHSLPPLAGLLWVWSALAIALGTTLRGIFLSGGLRIALAPKSKTVRVAGISERSNLTLYSGEEYARPYARDSYSRGA